MTTTEALARMYADQFVERFEHMEGNWSEPLVVPGQFPQQNIAGNAYRGCNRSFLPIIASFRKYRLPLWMTVSQMKDLDIWIRKGESGSPVSFTDLYIRDLDRDSRANVSVPEYDAMSPRERKDRRLAKVFRTRWYRVFNIGQTSFAETYPNATEELHRMFGAADGRQLQSRPLDRMVTDDTWLCPIRIDSGARAPVYEKDDDIIIIPEKGSFSDDRAYYGTLLRLMAHSTGSELRLDRGIWSDLLGDTAKEALVSELSAASMGALLGLGVTMDGNSEAFLKSWINTIEAAPSFIYDAVREAARAADCLAGVLGLELEKGVDVTQILSRQKAEKADKAAREKEVGVSRRGDTVRIGGQNRSKAAL